jgi:hypothetical protein
LKKGKKWLVFEQPVEVDPDGAELEQAIREALVILRDAGGAVAIRNQDGVLTIGAKRERADVEFDPGFESVGPLYETTAYIFCWQSFLPAVEKAEPLPEAEVEQEEEEPEPVEEPAAA